MTIVKETSPYLRKPVSVNRMMIDVLIALIPVFVFSFVAFKLDALRIVLISVGTICASEFIFVFIKNRMPLDVNRPPFKERFIYRCKQYRLSNFLSSLVTAIIYAMILPPSMSWYGIMVGGIIGITLGKLLFGGLGCNIFNPAAVGFVVTKICFPKDFVYSSTWLFDVQTGGTTLANIKESFANVNNYSVLDLFLGKCGGAIGEISAICILVGAIYLFIRRAADIRVTLSYIATFTLLMLFAAICVNAKKPEVSIGQFLGVQVFSGGMLFGAVFMITDPVTSPINSPGRVIFGILTACITVIIRLFGAFPEGMAFSILIGNMLSPVIDYYKWSGNKFTKKKIIWMVSIFAATALLVVLVLLFGGKVK